MHIGFLVSFCARYESPPGLQSDTLSYYCKVDGSQLNMDLKNGEKEWRWCLETYTKSFDLSGTAIQEIDGSEIDRVGQITWVASINDINILGSY